MIRAGIGLLAVFALSGLLAGCGGGGERVAQASLAQLATAAVEFDGDMVETEGVVQGFDDPEHYWLEDADRNRVAVKPHAAVIEHVGETLRVVGRFSFDPETGRSIEIHPAATAALRAMP